MIHTMLDNNSAIIGLNHKIDPRVLNLLIKMKNTGQSDGAIETADIRLRLIGKHADLDNPDTVTRYITSLQGSNNYKIALARTYTKYCKHYAIQWTCPTLRSDSKLIQIPLKAKLDALIASSGKTLSMKLEISKDTGLRPIELMNLKVKDIDIDQKTIYPTTAKHGSARLLKISDKLRTTIQNHIIRKGLTPNTKLFKGTAKQYGHAYVQMRNKLSLKLNDPSIKTIRLYDFRHYFASTLYHKTRDILYVKQQMGHKRIETTMIYVQLINVTDDEYTSQTANNVKQAQALIESGFEYVTGEYTDGGKIFRKRK